MQTRAGSSTRCPRSASRRIAGDPLCAKCGWHFEHPPKPDPEPELGSQRRPMVVEFRPDPFERRQVARWLLGAFEVALITFLVSTIAGWLGSALAMAGSQAIGNDLFGSAIASLVLGAVFALFGAYGALRYLAR